MKFDSFYFWPINGERRIPSPGGMSMRLIAFGGDERMRGALAAAEQAGWETLHIEREEDVERRPWRR